MGNGPGDGVDVGNPAGFVAGSIREGMSANESLQAFKDAGGAMRRQTFLRMYGEVTSAIANSPGAMSRDPFAVPSAGDLTPWTMGPGDQYATSVNVLFRDLDTGIVGHRQYLYVTDEPHAPIEAEQAAWDDFGDPEGEEAYGQKVIGTMTKNQYVTTRYER